MIYLISTLVLLGAVAGGVYFLRSLARSLDAEARNSMSAPKPWDSPSIYRQLLSSRR